LFFFTATAPTHIYTLSLHDALPISYKLLVEVTIPGVEKLRNTLKEKSEAYMNVVKIGRTHLMDATPLTLGQEFSGYVAQLDFGLDRKSTRLNSSHVKISYAVFCLKK